MSKTRLLIWISLLGYFTALSQESKLSLVVLGTVQDAGSPHIGCKKSCCTALIDQPDPSRKVVALGIIDHQYNKSILIEATPEMPAQLKLLQRAAGTTKEMPDAILLTHAHIGHYTGLMYIGREAMGAKGVPVYAMPKMEQFLSQNGPWSQLVDLKNIELKPLTDQKAINLTPNLRIVPFLVPHRDEYSETVGYKIIGPEKTALFIPDINKWAHWEKDIVTAIKEVDYAFLDATFFDGAEINHRDIASIPHPFVIESMALFKKLPKKGRAKVHFIHLNHTNPLLNTKSKAYSTTRRKGYHIATFLQQFAL